MIRTLTCSLLLVCCTGAMAEKLYRWVEADGSITFSPTPPAGDTTYKTVSGATPAVDTPATTAVKPAGSSKKAVPATVQQDAPADARKLAAAQAAATDPAPAPANTPTQLRYAPDTSITPLGKPAAEASTRARTGSSKLPLIASSSKRQHCQDLRKRVVSLERRLRTALAPEDMDNTVVHMARYQQSFDQFCR